MYRKKHRAGDRGVAGTMIVSTLLSCATAAFLPGMARASGLAGRYPEYEIYAFAGLAFAVSLLLAGLMLWAGRKLLLAHPNRRLRELAEQKNLALVKLGQSRAQLANALSMGKMGMWEWRPQKNTSKWSGEIFSICDLPVDSVPSHDLLLRVIHPDDRQRFGSVVDRTIKTLVPFNFDHRILRPNGEIRYIHHRGAAVRGKAHGEITINGIMVDVTEREMSAREIRKLNQDLERRVADRTRKLTREVSERNMAEAKSRFERDRAERYLKIAGSIIVALDRDNRIELINKKGCEVLEYDESGLIGCDWISSVIPIDEGAKIKGVLEKFHNAPHDAARDASISIRSTVMTRTGRKKLVSWEITALFDHSGNPAGTLSAGTDITELVMAEEKIRTSEKHYRSVLNTTSQGFWMKDSSLRIVEVNSSLC